MEAQELILNENFPKVASNQPTAVQVEKDKIYAWCTCGLSSKITFCDGQHKKIEGNPYVCLKVSFEEEKEVWLCNCKQTKNPPYCDGSHNSIKKDL